MKAALSALTLAALLGTPAAATHYEISEHTTSIIVHVEATNATHAASGKGK